MYLMLLQYGQEKFFIYFYVWVIITKEQNIIIACRGK